MGSPAVDAGVTHNTRRVLPEVTVRREETVELGSGGTNSLSEVHLGDFTLLVAEQSEVVVLLTISGDSAAHVSKLLGSVHPVEDDGVTKQSLHVSALMSSET